MKLNRLFLVFTTLFLFASINPNFVQAENIDTFESSIEINKDASIDITETIQYDFGAENRHGIFREIPLVYENSEGKKYKLEFELNSVSIRNQIGQFVSVPYDQSGNSEITLKIGDPNTTISGEHTYSIDYTLKGPIQYFSDHDELYFNAVGTGWDVPITSVLIRITAQDVSGLITQSETICYTGPQGSTERICEIQKSDDAVVIKTTSPLGTYEGLTFAMKFPKGLIDVYEMQEYSPGLLERFWAWLIAIPLLLNLIIPVGMLFYWYKRGRDPKDNRVLVRMYDPPKKDDGKLMTPLEMGTITDESIHSRDISAEIVNLAIKKYIVIRETTEKKFLGFGKDKDIILEQGSKLKEDFEMKNLHKYQIDIIKALKLDEKDLVNLKDLTGFPKALSSLKSDVYKDLTNQSYFKGNPTHVRTKYFIAAFVLFFFTLVIPGIIVAAFAYFMPSKTQKGVEAQRHALGLKQFLESQERQFEFQEKNLYLFEKLLPYAISFGVAKIWAEKFAEFQNYDPDWYKGANASALNTALLVSSLESGLSRVEQSYSPTKSSSGYSSGFSGGSSGGGFGGGGGGSW